MIPLVLFIAGLVSLLFAIPPWPKAVSALALGLFLVFLAIFLNTVVGLPYPQ